MILNLKVQLIFMRLLGILIFKLRLRTRQEGSPKYGSEQHMKAGMKKNIKKHNCMIFILTTSLKISWHGFYKRFIKRDFL
jgi:hypothetical protein